MSITSSASTSTSKTASIMGKSMSNVQANIAEYRWTNMNWRTSSPQSWIKSMKILWWISMLRRMETILHGAPLPTATPCFNSMPPSLNIPAKNVITSIAWSVDANSIKIWHANSIEIMSEWTQKTVLSSIMQKELNSNNVLGANFGCKETKAVQLWNAVAVSNFVISVAA